MANFRTILIKGFIPLLVIATAILISVILIKSKKPPQRKEAGKSIPIVEYIVAKKSDYRTKIEVYGRVRAADTVSITSVVSGKIIYISPELKEGSLVTKDSIIARIDPLPYERNLVKAESDLSEAELNLLLEEERARLAREEWKGLGSGRMNELASREAHLEVAKTRRKLAQIQLKNAKKELQDTIIKSPVDGRIMSKSINKGAYVSIGSQIATLYPLDAFEVPLPIPEKDLPFIGSINTEHKPVVTIRYETDRGSLSWVGKIVRLGPAIDQLSQSVTAIARITDPYSSLKTDGTVSSFVLMPGLFVTGIIDGILIRDVFIVKRTLISPRNEMLLIDGNDRIRIVTVRVERYEGDKAIITEGLKDGDRICTTRIDTVIDGMNVRPVEEVKR